MVQGFDCVACGDGVAFDFEDDKGEAHHAHIDIDQAIELIQRMADIVNGQIDRHNQIAAPGTMLQ